MESTKYLVLSTTTAVAILMYLTTLAPVASQKLMAKCVTVRSLFVELGLKRDLYVIVSDCYVIGM